MYKVCYYISRKMCAHGIVPEEDIDALCFTLEVILSQKLTFIAMLLIGVLLRLWLETIVYLAVFTTTRKIIGGYHAKTFFMCFVYSVISFVLVIVLSIIPFPYILLWIPTFLMVIGLRKRLVEKEYRKLFISVFCCFGIVSIAKYFASLTIVNITSLTIFCVLIMKYKELREENDTNCISG